MTNYYLVPESMARELKVTDYRNRAATGEYILNGGDLIAYDIEMAIRDGAREITESEARELIKQSNNN